MTLAAPSCESLNVADAQAIRNFLASIGTGDIGGIARLEGGRNNRVYRVNRRGERIVVKWYHNDAIGKHDRLAAEFAFVRFANEHGINETPKAIACDRTRNMAAYEFIEGAPLQPGEVGARECAAAAAFVRSLNAHRESAAARALPAAAEACFSIDDHLSLVAERIARLAAIQPRDEIDCKAMAFVDERLLKSWQRVESKSMRQSRRNRIDPAAILSPIDRCLSPSDFGFHNALRRPDGTLAFIDFEYAGWDDPAKLVGDFFCQPAVPAPMACYESFVRDVAQLFERPDVHRTRIELLRSVYQIKWCCIALNEFLPDDARRRRFAGQVESLTKAKAQQLALARNLLAAIDVD